MAKKIIYIITSLFIAFIATFFIWHYVSYARDRDPYKMFLLPRLELSEIQFVSFTPARIDIIANLLIKNQFPIALTADSLQYQVYINNTEVIKDHYEKSISLKSDQITLVSLPITLFHKNLVSLLNAAIRAKIDSAEYTFHVTFFTHIPFKKDFTINIKRFLPLLLVPEIKEDHLEIRSMNFSQAQLILTIALNNPNTFPIMLKNLDYGITIEGSQLVQGSVPGVSEIKAKSDSEIKVPLNVSVKEVGQTLLDLLKKGNNQKCAIKLAFQIDSNNDMFKNSKVSLESEAPVKSLLKAKVQ